MTSSRTCRKAPCGALVELKSVATRQIVARHGSVGTPASAPGDERREGSVTCKAVDRLAEPVAGPAPVLVGESKVGAELRSYVALALTLALERWWGWIAEPVT